MKIVLILIGLIYYSCSQKDEKNQTKLQVWQVPNVFNAAEAYFSPDNDNLICNAKFENDTTHQVYTLDLKGENIKQINNTGDDACSYYFPDNQKLIWTSTRDNLDMSKGDWSNPNEYPQGAELYVTDLDGKNIIRLTNNKYYDAEVSVSPDGKSILFTRQTDGNLDLWKMNVDGTEEKQITHTPDWQEGGAFYMPDSKTIIYRAWEKKKQAKKGMPMTIFTIKDDGMDLRQITSDSGTNWAPHPAPDGKHFVFVKVVEPRNFEIFLMNVETKVQKRLTFNDAFDGFPVISPNGKLLTFSSNRHNLEEKTLTLFLMDISLLNLSSKN
jgi:Tol biopolymer transport system component